MVYVWHCDKDGYYSGYNQSGADLRGQTLLRGVQTTDTNGRVTFNTIYPGWYPGRATHIHFRVYLGLALQATSQLAFPTAITSAVYTTPLYVANGQNPTTPSSDGIFSDGVSYQMPLVTENAATGGYDAELTVGIAPHRGRSQPAAGICRLAVQLRVLGPPPSSTVTNHLMWSRVRRRNN